MGSNRPIVHAWVAAVAVAALAVSLVSVQIQPADSASWIALGLLTLCAAVAHVFPIKSAAGGVSYRLTNVFLMASAVLLPSSLLVVLPALANAPDFYVRRHRPFKRLAVGWLFNVGQSALATHAAAAWVNWIGRPTLEDPKDLIALVGAAAIFTLVQAALVGVVIALDQQVPISRAPTFAGPALLSDSLMAALGLAVAGVWLTKPLMMSLVPLILFVAHRLTRTAHLAHLAGVDVKTGLHNYQHFENVLEQELTHSLRVGRPLALLFVDLDYFKKVNDTYGHAAGDQVLRDLSMLLTSSMRKDDIIARFGGEEFVVLLPGTDVDQAMYLGERVRSAVESHTFVVNGGTELRCTVSVGAAGCPTDATTLQALVEQADSAMYRAKKTRNAVARPEARAVVPSLQAAPAASARESAPAPAPKRTDAVMPSRFAPVMLWSTVAVGALFTAWSIAQVVFTSSWAILLPFLALSVASEFLNVQVFDANRQRISLSFTNVVTMAALMVAPDVAPLVNLAAAVVHAVMTRQRQLEKVLFNLANLVLAVVAAGRVYSLLRPSGTEFTAVYLAAGLAAVVVYYAANVGIISVMISLHTRRSLIAVFRQSAWFAPTNILLGLTGAFLGEAHVQLGVVGVAMFIVPLLVLRFTLTFYARQTQRQIERLEAAKSEVEAAHAEKEEMLRKLIETVALIIDARDNSVSGHSRRVAKFAVAIGKELGMTTSDLAVIHTAGLFHDLGKVGIPEAILHKPSRLTADEYTVIKEHAALGSRILSEVPQLADIAKMVGEHHERFDGTGYPLGLASDNITLGGRILVVADALETMLADRPYSKGRPLQVALDELDRCSGSHFDPDIVSAVHRAVRAQGADFFNNSEQRPADRDWNAAEQLLAQVFA